MIAALLYNSVPKNDSPFSVYSEFFRDPKVLSLKEKIYRKARREDKVDKNGEYTEYVGYNV